MYPLVIYDNIFVGKLCKEQAGLANAFKLQWCNKFYESESQRIDERWNRDYREKRER